MQTELPTGQVSDESANFGRAFAQMHQHEAAPTATAVRFKWCHLVVFDQLGAGGYGEVFRAFDATLKREVALKLQRSNHRFAPAAGRAFIEEARRLAQVRHPNVLAVHGAAVDTAGSDRRAGIWTDLIIGETLSAQIARDGPLAAVELLRLLTELSAAVAAVHAQAIVHGDLKPANVMQEAGQAGRFVLMDFGAGAKLDDHGRARLTAGSMHFMAPEQRAGKPLGTAADLYALGATAFFAATGQTLALFEDTPDAERAHWLKLHLQRALAGAGAGVVAGNHTAESAKPLATKRLGVALAELVAELLGTEPEARPSAAVFLKRCHALASAPARRQRQRLYRALTAVLLLALLALSTALIVTLHARDAIVLERNRALSVRDFLLSIVRNADPLQSANPTRNLTVLFENAVSALPKAFADDPRSEAQLLNQFGRSLLVLDQDASGLAALTRADALLELAGVAHTDVGRIDTRSYLGRAYRIRREYGPAAVLANEQAKLCTGKAQAPASSCLQIVNDQIQAVGYGGDPARALVLVEENLARANAANLATHDRAAFSQFLQSYMRRDLGDYPGARAAMITLVDRTLNASEVNAPGMLFGLMWLALSADDLGNITLARSINNDALIGYEALYGKTSHYTTSVRMRAATLALHAGDALAARQITQTLMALPNSATYAPVIESATVLAALADDVSISDSTLDLALSSRALALGEHAAMVLEMRIDLAAVAIKRQQWTRAESLLETVRADLEQPRFAALQPSYALQIYNLATRAPSKNLALAASAQAKALALLAQQQRRIFDPVSADWVGQAVPDAKASSLEIAQAAARIRAGYVKSM